MRGVILRALLVGLAAAAASAMAGGPLSVCSGVPTKYAGAGTVSLNYDRGNLGSLSKAQADSLVTSAVSVWTNVGTATVALAKGADMPVDVTEFNYTTYVGNGTFGDGLNPVVYDNDGMIIDSELGAGASKQVLGYAGSAWYSYPTYCQYAEGRAVLNGLAATSTMMPLVITHEIGHLIGLDHTELDGQQGLPTSNYPVMYPIAYRTTNALHEDDAAAISALYPDTTLNAAYGQVSGYLTQANGTPVLGANIWANEVTTGKLYSIVSDYLQQGNGYFKLLLPPGTYNLHVGAIRTGFTGGSSVGPYSETSAGSSFQAPLYVNGTAMSAVVLGGAAPTAFSIIAGCSASATFRLDGSGGVTGNCGGQSLSIAKAGSGSGTVSSNPGGISCGATCAAYFATGAAVTLTATPDSGSSFAGWSGACSGTGACTVSMSGARAVTATFTANYTGTLAVRYRLYSSGTGEHLYTTNLYEYQTLASQGGWAAEGAIYKIFSGPGSFGGVAAVPYMRLYNPASFQHHWTTDAGEYAYLATVGWQQEGIDGYILPSQASGTVPLYRLYLNARGGLHLWTIDANEANTLRTTAGWVLEGISGYVLPLP